ncbi:hypothetical protein BC749_1143 [Flavobacterium araucananum]|uniref:Uncharacterized protein n=1 Tax=Flavobacterium araucananum TaxID=946678 RepID=A0A227NBY8_9FLAO|nr:hypothetical protein [Flavobacterium araucananum]OXE95006.1 hypothetical protein B0A64_24775 [Flavobacterium araucananum]PWJ95340.1 hypothetical protein BC749_1143 [Flavobacterium araucananum]
MEAKEIKDLEYLRKLMSLYLNTLKTPIDNTEYYTAQIKLSNYSELGCIISNMLKLCILALDSEAQKISETIKNPSINVALILEVVLQLFPVDEFELLSEINEFLIADLGSIKE